MKDIFKSKTRTSPLCICPGGMMNMISTELMEQAGIKWPEAHMDAKMMADLAAASYEQGCFENVGVPFCMTTEAEAMGAAVTMGTEIYEPHVTGYALEKVEDWEKLSSIIVNEGRCGVTVEAIKLLKEKQLVAPIVGNITGPISIASSLIEPVTFYKALRKQPEQVHALLEFVTEQTIKFAIAQIKAGADIIAISDPSGTGEIMGPKYFREYTVKYLNMLLDALKEYQVGTIVHICGQMKNVYAEVAEVHSDVLSFDAVVPMAEARKELPNHLLMGNVSTYTLEFGDEEKIAVLTKHCVNAGADIIAPACGLGTKSPLKNIQAMLKTLKNEE